jgi:hypothetical protein
MKKFQVYLSILFFFSLLLDGCEDNSVNNGSSDPNLLYSTDEIVCDYNDSTTIQFDTTIYPVYMKTLFIQVTDRSFSNVKISGTVDTFYAHNEMAGQNPVLIMGVLYDTLEWHVGDSITYYHRYSGDFLNVTPVTYPENMEYMICFAMQVSDPARGDFIKVKNLKIYKSE